MTAPSPNASPEAARFERIAAAMTRVVEAVPDDRWDDPSPCEDWRARDVVGHLAEWMPALFFDRWGLDRPAIPSVEDDPVATWSALRDALQTALGDPALATETRDLPPGPMPFAVAVDRLGTNDVLFHTWDLARATGGDERLDPDEVDSLLAGMEPMDEVMRASGQYGPRIPVPADAPAQDRLMAFLGRQP